MYLNIYKRGGIGQDRTGQVACIINKEGAYSTYSTLVEYVEYASLPTLYLVRKGS